RPHPFPLPHPPSLRYGAVRCGYRVEAKRRRKERELISTEPWGRDGMLPSLITGTATRGPSQQCAFPTSESDTTRSDLRRGLLASAPKAFGAGPATAGFISKADLLTLPARLPLLL